MDRVLHADRVEGRQQRRFSTGIASLPDHVFVTVPERGPAPRLLRDGQLFAWSHDGYGAPEPAAGAGFVEVLTPLVMVDVLRAGYRPLVALPETLACGRPPGAAAQAAMRG